MATKKQKREAAKKRHDDYMEELRLSGLAAQKADRAHRHRKELDAWEEQHNKKHSWKNRIKECPHCQIIMHAASKKPANVDEQEAS